MYDFQTFIGAKSRNLSYMLDLQNGIEIEKYKTETNKGKVFCSVLITH